MIFFKQQQQEEKKKEKKKKKKKKKPMPQYTKSKNIAKYLEYKNTLIILVLNNEFIESKVKNN